MSAPRKDPAGGVWMERVFFRRSTAEVPPVPKRCDTMRGKMWGKQEWAALPPKNHKYSSPYNY